MKLPSPRLKAECLGILKERLRDIIEQTSARAIAQEDGLMRSLSDTLMALAEVVDLLEREALVTIDITEPEFRYQGTVTGRAISKKPCFEEVPRDSKSISQYLSDYETVPEAWVGDLVQQFSRGVYRVLQMNDLALVVKATPGSTIRSDDLRLKQGRLVAGAKFQATDQED